MLAADRLDALITPTDGPAARIDINGDHFLGGGDSGLPAIAGYPHLTVPMGQVQGLPIGLSFIGAAWSEAALLALGYAFEQAMQARRAPTYRPSQEYAEAVIAAISAPALIGAIRRLSPGSRKTRRPSAAWAGLIQHEVEGQPSTR